MDDLGLLDRFNMRFKSMAPYPGFAKFSRSYSKVSSWQGKEMRTLMRFLLAVAGPLLTERIKSTKCQKAEVLQCIQSLCEFHLVVGQWSHSEYTCDLLQGLLQKFYDSKSALWFQRSMNARTVRFKNLCHQNHIQVEKLLWTDA